MSTRLKALKQHNEEKSCRICFGNDQEGDDSQKKDEDEKEKEKEKEKEGPKKHKSSRMKRIENPLLAPCNCTGSSRYIHLKCL